MLNSNFLKTFEIYLIFIILIIIYAKWVYLSNDISDFENFNIFYFYFYTFNDIIYHFIVYFDFIKNFIINFNLFSSFLHFLKNAFLKDYFYFNEFYLNIFNQISNNYLFFNINPNVLYIEDNFFLFYKFFKNLNLNLIFYFWNNLNDFIFFYFFFKNFTYQNSYILFDLIFYYLNYNLNNKFLLNFEDLILIILSLCLIISILISVAFFTLLERKVMASMQRRKGPDNRISGFWGILQPLADGLKLLTKEIIIPKRATLFIFIGAPMYTFLMSLMGWCVIPWTSNIIFADPKLSSLYVFAISSLGVYGILLAGWASNSKYAFLGSLRSAAQMISYEVSLGFILIIVALFSGTYNFREIVFKQESIWYCIPLLPLVFIFFVSMLAETNRAPFDLPEAEAELVSGYNTEYSSIIFAMFFLGEYSSMLLMSSIFVIFFFGGWLGPFNFFFFNGFWFFLKIIFVAFSYVWVRATLPRYRYNQLMSIGWKIFLPLTFGLLIFYSGFLLYFDGIPENNFDLGIYYIESFFNFNIDLFLQLNNLIIK